MKGNNRASLGLLVGLAGLGLMFASITMVSDTKGLARVEKVEGVPVYVMCEPVDPYEVQDRIKVGMKLSAKMSPNVRDHIRKLVKQALKEKEKRRLQFDALITSDGNNATAITWK